MYPVTATYKTKIKELERVFQARIQIQHSQGVLNLTDKDIALGSLIYNEASQAGEDFTIGGVVASDLTVNIVNKPEYANLQFVGATLTASIGLQLAEDKWELQEVEPDTWEEVQVSEEAWEWVPLGVFHIDEIGKTRNVIRVKAIDAMINLDIPYSLSQLVYPATLLQIFTNICNVCDIQQGSYTFPNSEHVVKDRPDVDSTFRDILAYVAELSGTFARTTRTGALELVWYEESGLTLTGANRFDFVPRDDVIQITGIIATMDGVTYIAGTDEYVVDLSNNPLLQGNYETVLGTIYNAVKDTSFYPFTSQWQGDPAVQAGDIITQVDRDGKPYKTLVTHSTYKYRGASTLQGKGLPVKAKGYKGSTNRKFAEIIRKIDEVVGDKLTTLEQAQLHATEMIANMLGGHAIFTDDAIYIADSEDLDEAVKVWKWGLGGFGYSSTGKDGPYTTAITADGTIVAMLVAAGIVTADMIQTGVLQSQDGSSWFNLDNGTFNLKDMFKWANNLLTLNQPDDEARLIVGPNVFAMQAYDETEEDWVNKIYFDPVRGKYVFDGLLSADAIQAVAAVIDYVVSDIIFTQILYAEKGNISELTVDQLDTSTMVAKYLNSDTSNVDYIKIWGQHIHWIEAVVKDGDPTPTVQLTDRKNNPLYWVDEDSIGMYTTFEETDYPVVVYEYDLNPKLKIDFELDPVTGYNVPIMTWGMGSDPSGQTNKGKAYIYKDETGLIFRYINEYNETFDLRIGEDGIQVSGIDAAPASKSQVRNTFVSTDAPDDSSGEDGDVWLMYQDTGGGEE